MRKLFLLATSLTLLSVPAFAAMSRPVYPLCSDIEARSCIADGTAFWYGGEFVRLQNVVPPPTQAACADGSAATARLFELLNYREIFVFRYGTDAEGHTLSRVISQGRDVSQVLVSEDLASSAASGGAWCS